MRSGLFKNNVTKNYLLTKHKQVIFVAASNQTGLEIRSMTRGSIKVGIRGGESQA